MRKLYESTLARGLDLKSMALPTVSLWLPESNIIQSGNRCSVGTLLINLSVSGQDHNESEVKPLDPCHGLTLIAPNSELVVPPFQ